MELLVCLRWATLGLALRVLSRCLAQQEFLVYRHRHRGCHKWQISGTIPHERPSILRQDRRYQQRDRHTKDIYLPTAKRTGRRQSRCRPKQLQLTKLGNELHGPEDAMYVERSQVLFGRISKMTASKKKIAESEAQKK